MPCYAGIEGDRVVSLCHAPARINAERSHVMNGVEQIVELPSRDGWTFPDAQAYLFPLPLAPVDRGDDPEI